MNRKYKILTLSDHPLAPSGVGTACKALISGMLSKYPGKYSFKSLGGAIKHSNYEVMQPHPDFTIKPVDGFGSKDMIKQILLTEQPDAVFLFTDPRQFIWVWEMEEEIRQVCPIVYWHVWDNDPYPKFNEIWYKSTDLINCLSWKTYELVKPHFPERTHYIPHAFPKEQFYPMNPQEVDRIKADSFGNKKDWFKVLWVNRNAHRKRPADLLACWKEFLDQLEVKYGHRNALLVCHTDPEDIEGPNLYAVADHYQIQENILFSTDKVNQDYINVLHNVTDTTINISNAEGFGISTLLAMMCGKPIIALCTGGETRQVIDYRDGSEHGAAIQPASRQLTGSQLVPYIYEDYSCHKDVVNALMKIFEMTPEEKVKMKEKVLAYVDHEFSYDKMISEWDRTLETCITNFKKTHKRWECMELGVSTPISQPKEVVQPVTPAKVEETVNIPMDITKEILKSIEIVEEGCAA